MQIIAFAIAKNDCIFLVYKNLSLLYFTNFGQHLEEKRIELLTGIVPVNKLLLARTVPVNKLLLAGTDPVNKLLLAGTVPVNNLLLAGTVQVNKFLLAGTPKKFKFPTPSKYPLVRPQKCQSFDQRLRRTQFNEENQFPVILQL